MNEEDILSMNIGEDLHYPLGENEAVKINRVVGGWIYRFYTVSSVTNMSLPHFNFDIGPRINFESSQFVPEPLKPIQ